MVIPMQEKRDKVDTKNVFYLLASLPPEVRETFVPQLIDAATAAGIKTGDRLRTPKKMGPCPEFSKYSLEKRLLSSFRQLSHKNKDFVIELTEIYVEREKELSAK